MSSTMNESHLDPVARRQAAAIETLKSQAARLARHHLQGLQGRYRWERADGAWLFDLDVGERLAWADTPLADPCDVAVVLQPDILAQLVEKQFDPLNLFNTGRMTIRGGSSQLRASARQRVQKLLNVMLNQWQIDAAAKQAIERLSLNGAQFQACACIDTEQELLAYMAIGSPVIQRTSCLDWPLFQRTPQQIAAPLEELEISLLLAEYAVVTEQPAQYRKMRFSAYVAALYGDSGIAGYMAANPVPSELDGTYRYPQVFPRAAFNAPRWWVGPKGAGLKLHRDLVDNFLYQVKGSKRIKLFAPSETNCLYPLVIGGNPFYEPSKVNPDQPDYAAYPESRKAKSVSCDLHAGEMLYLPAGWWHQVVNQETSWSLNFFAVNQPPYVMRPQPGPDRG